MQTNIDERPLPTSRPRLFRCQCFFAAEKFKTGRGVQLDAFDGHFRCPANIGCILNPPPGLVTTHGRTPRSFEDLSSSSLVSGWKNDIACPFGECLFDSAGDDRTVQSCSRDAVIAGLFGLVAPSEACELHPGAEFCIRTNEATSNGANTGIGNQVCTDTVAGLVRGHTAASHVLGPCTHLGRVDGCALISLIC